jgi:primosomal protein N' (replication factor Y)
MDFLAYAAGVANMGNESIMLYDPVPATISKIAGHHRGHVLVQCGSRTQLQRFLAEWRCLLVEKKARRVRWTIDVDPIEL